MKKIFVVLLCLFCATNVSHAEKVVGSYLSQYFDQTYEIEAAETKTGALSIYIQVSAKSTGTRAMINLTGSEIGAFKSALLQTKDKFVEWSKVAKDNNVAEMNKEMDIKFPSMTVCWLGSKWFFSFGVKIKPSFIILDSGKHVVSFTKTVKSSSNEYIDEKIYLVFEDPAEIDELLSQINEDKIMVKLKESSNAEALFQ